MNSLKTVLLLGSLNLDLSQKGLGAAVEKLYPAKAAAWIETHRKPGPILNHYNWGGYLLWRLPDYPVSIDGRTYVYASEFIQHSARMWNGAPGWEADPEIARASVVVGSLEHPLVVLLARDARFERAYEDAVSAVYVRKE